MARYKPGDTVAFTKNFQRGGQIVSLDTNGRGYKINTGADIIYAYENQIVLISDEAPIRPPQAIQKIDAIAEGLPEYTPEVRCAFLALLESHSKLANQFACYLAKVSDSAIRACIQAIANSRVEKIEVNISIDLFPIHISPR